jgi:hypothetical protein
MEYGRDSGNPRRYNMKIVEDKAGNPTLTKRSVLSLVVEI